MTWFDMNPGGPKIPARHRKKLLAEEAMRRKSGDWGPWGTMERDEFKDFRSYVTGGQGGWLAEIQEVRRNKVFSVLVRPDGESGALHLAIGSLSGIRPTWHEMQRIKDELLGETVSGIEVYPPKAEIVDGADMFHLWCFNTPLPVSLWRAGNGRLN